MTVVQIDATSQPLSFWGKEWECHPRTIDSPNG